MIEDRVSRAGLGLDCAGGRLVSLVLPMRRIFVSLAAALMFAGVALLPAPRARAFSLSSLLHSDAGHRHIAIIHVADLVAIKHNPDAHAIIYDVNLLDVREKYGVIPGAILLPSASHYAIDSLPADHKARLVFYCTNLH